MTNNRNLFSLLLPVSALLLSCGGSPSTSSSVSTPYSSSESTSEVISSSSLEASEEGESSEASSSLSELSEEPFLSLSGEEPSFEESTAPSLTSKYRNYYQLLIYSFADGDGDGIGDFKGIIDHLDYLKDLGIGGLYLSPIHEAASYHCYDVIDYYSVNHRYEVSVGGVNYTFNTLLSKCHEKGLSVIIDLVLNHSSDQCAWTRDHPSWYKTPDAFPGSMKDFDYDNLDLREEIKNVGKYWLEKGVDGFRLDAAKWIYNYSDTNGEADDRKNYAWWNEFYESCKQTNENVYMVAEVLSDDFDVVNYYSSGMDSNFAFGSRKNILNSVWGRRGNYFTTYVSEFQSEIRRNNPNAIEAPVISNHDIGRFQHLNDANLKPRPLSLAGVMNILSPGNSFVYYGEELGMDGTCSNTRANYYADLNYRTPMPFESGRTNSNNYLYSYVPGKDMTTTTYNNLTADEAHRTNAGFYRCYQKALSIKNRLPFLFDAEVKKGKDGGDYQIGSLIYTKGEEKATAIFNCGDSPKQIKFNTDIALLGEASLESYSYVASGLLCMPAYSAAIIDGSPSILSVTRGPIEGEPVTETPLPLPFGAQVNSEKEGSLTLHFLAPASWSGVNCYAWVNNNQYLGGWPGRSLSKQAGTYTITLDHGASNVIFNNGNDQTIDLYRNGPGEYWFKPSSESGKNISGNWYDKNPDQ